MKRKFRESSPFLLQSPKQALLLAARLMRGNSRQIDVYAAYRVQEYDKSWAFYPQAYQFRWCRRDKRYYGELIPAESILADVHKWRYWLNDWFPLVVADGVPLSAIAVVHKLENMKLERIKNMPPELKHLVQKRAPAKLDHPVYCPDCRDWLPTVQLRHVCPHMLNCIDTPKNGCGVKRYVKEECRKYKTCFIDLDDRERQELIRSICKESNRKHGWSRRLANKPLMKAPIDVWSDPRRYTVRAKDYGR